MIGFRRSLFASNALWVSLRDTARPHMHSKAWMASECVFTDIHLLRDSSDISGKNRETLFADNNQVLVSEIIVVGAVLFSLFVPLRSCNPMSSLSLRLSALELNFGIIICDESHRSTTKVSPYFSPTKGPLLKNYLWLRVRILREDLWCLRLWFGQRINKVMDSPINDFDITHSVNVWLRAKINFNYAFHLRNGLHLRPKPSIIDFFLLSENSVQCFYGLLNRFFITFHSLLIEKLLRN